MGGGNKPRNSVLLFRAGETTHAADAFTVKPYVELHSQQVFSVIGVWGGLTTVLAQISLKPRCLSSEFAFFYWEARGRD